MGSILEKFENVEIKSYSRLSPEDLKFCEEQQELYDKTRLHYLRMFAGMEKLQHQELSFRNGLKRQRKENGSLLYIYNFIKMDADMKKDTILQLHQYLIRTIISHFNEKYAITATQSSWEKYIHLDKPEQPSIPHGRFNRDSEEWKTYQDADNRYKAAYSVYIERLIHSRLTFIKILDDIFAYLGGFSFNEKAETEIKELVYEKIRREKYSIHNRKLSFYGLVTSSLNYSNNYQLSLNSEGYLAVLKALTFYDSQKKNFKIYRSWADRFTTYPYSGKDENTGIYSEHDACGNHVLQFKYFKNGRWDVTFDTGAHALEFARTYLRYEEVA